MKHPSGFVLDVGLGDATQYQTILKETLAAVVPIPSRGTHCKQHAQESEDDHLEVFQDKPNTT